MCRGVRWTHSLGTLNSRMCFRVRVARFTRADLRSLVISLLLLFLLRFLPGDILVAVPDALTLIWLGRSIRSDLRRGLADTLFVGATYYDPGLTRSLDAYILRTPILHRMRKPERQVQYASLHLGAISDSYEPQFLLKTVTDARHHIRNERSGSSGLSERARSTILRPTRHSTILTRHLDRCMDVYLKSTLWTTYRHRSRLDRNVDTGRNINRHFCDSRHLNVSATTRRCKRLRRHTRRYGLGDQSSDPSASR